MAHPDPTSRVRILVGDGDPIVRSALRLVLDRTFGLGAVSEASDAARLLSAAAADPPDLVLVDWNLPGLHPTTAFAALHAALPGAAIVILATRPELRTQALAAGADAFVSKADDPTLLLAAIRHVVHP